MSIPDNLLSSDSQTGVASLVADLRSLAIRALGRMYVPEQRLFAFTLRKRAGGLQLEGISRRYTAISLIGLFTETSDVHREVLRNHLPEDLISGLIAAGESTQDVGEAALTLWAARLWRHAEAARSLKRLEAMAPVTRSCPTVEFSWCLTALSVPSDAPGNEALRDSAARRLLGSFRHASGLFPHWPDDAQPSRMASHVACFADLVYPIQALSYYHRATGSAEALSVARRCADTMCKLQGQAGQWWWHYDTRTGRVVEGYPVYAIHQDAMGPMALYALRDAGGEDHHAAIVRSLQWLERPPEITGSLIDREADVIWRKVARREPNKLSRRVQALASRLHPSFRAPGVDVLFPPVQVDEESRPYHMGWLLHAFPAGRMS